MSNVPMHEPVGTDTNNWTTLSDKEAHIRAKAVEKGHMPHDWRWAGNKMFKTDKFYPKELRGEALENVPNTDKETTDFQDEEGQRDFSRDTNTNTNENRGTTDFVTANDTPQPIDPQNQSMQGYEGMSGQPYPGQQSGGFESGRRQEANWEGDRNFDRNQFETQNEAGHREMGSGGSLRERPMQTNMEDKNLNY